MKSDDTKTETLQSKVTEIPECEGLVLRHIGNREQNVPEP